MAKAKSGKQNKQARKHIEVNGIVQGVGFRPFVFNLARSFHLTGFVTNTSNGVIVEVEGPEKSIERFLEALPAKKPPLAEIISVESSDVPLQHSTAFTIIASIDSADNQTLIAPDIAICDDCLRELRDPNDRRYQYPFINCTNCGPRFTIIKRIPYDRPNTSMASFTMCSQCQKEYDDPSNRRFHAQPNACPDCGPFVWLESVKSQNRLALKSEAVERTVDLLLQGQIVAIKGLGGFHLACDATNEQAVQRLRVRKNREQKPFAIMVPDLKTAQALVDFTRIEQELLRSPQRPIVLLKKRQPNPVAAAVAPHNQRLGIMLPYTPLHYLIFDALTKRVPPSKPVVLVMTSANRSEEPIVIDNQEARQRLADIADFLLLHNRDILIRADDSVVAQFNNQLTFFRRSRGYVPRPVFLKLDVQKTVLGTGGELKNTICLSKGRRAFLSQHIGDLENLRANRFFEDTIQHFEDILQTKPELIVCDLHPGYFSTQWAEQQSKAPVIKVQHHHAHLAACLAEWQLDEPVIGVILDGTGFGYDGTIWGGEFLIGDFTRVERMACFKPLPLPGGTVAIKQPWRMALSYLYQTFKQDLPPLPWLKNKPVSLIIQQIQKGLNAPLTSSCGRLFDAAAVISGGRQQIHYEAQAAIEFTQAVTHTNVEPLEFEGDLPYISFEPVIKNLVTLVLQGKSFSELAAYFHVTLAHWLKEATLKVAQQTGLKKVVLSGGVFQNEVLLHLLTLLLKKHHLKVFTHHQVPPNDGGIALGQCAIGLKLLQKGLDRVTFFDHVKIIN